MKCSEVERVLPELVDGSLAAAFPADFESHLESCPACANLVSDLTLIATEARDLAECDEPSPRVWVRIAAQLRDEGLIRDPESRPILVPASPRRRWTSTAWWLAPVAAAVLAAGAYVVSHKPAPQVATQVSAPAPSFSRPREPPLPGAPRPYSIRGSTRAPRPQTRKSLFAISRLPRGIPRTTSSAHPHPTAPVLRSTSRRFARRKDVVSWQPL